MGLFGAFSNSVFRGEILKIFNIIFVLVVNLGFINGIN